MAIAQFTPVGREPRWRAIYRLLSGKPVGTLITYEQLDDATGTNFRTKRTPIYQAVKVLEREEKRTLVAAVNEGYRVAAAIEHEGLARKRQRRSTRQMDRAVSILSNVHREELDPEQVRRIDAMELRTRAQADMLRRLTGRVQRQEDGLRAVRRSTSETVAGQNERIERLEALIERAGLVGAENEPVVA